MEFAILGYGLSCLLPLVDIFAMAYCKYQNNELGLFDLADDAIVLHAETPQPDEIVTEWFCKYSWIAGWKNAFFNVSNDQALRGFVELS